MGLHPPEIGMFICIVYNENTGFSFKHVAVASLDMLFKAEILFSFLHWAEIWYEGYEHIVFSCPFLAVSVAKTWGNVCPFPTTPCCGGLWLIPVVLVRQHKKHRERIDFVCACRYKNRLSFCVSGCYVAAYVLGRQTPSGQSQIKSLTCLWPLRKTVYVTSQGPVPGWLKAAETISRLYRARSDRIAPAYRTPKIKGCFVPLCITCCITLALSRWL